MQVERGHLDRMRWCVGLVSLVVWVYIYIFVLFSQLFRFKRKVGSANLLSFPYSSFISDSFSHPFPFSLCPPSRTQKLSLPYLSHSSPPRRCPLRSNRPLPSYSTSPSLSLALVLSSCSHSSLFNGASTLPHPLSSPSPLSLSLPSSTLLNAPAGRTNW